MYRYLRLLAAHCHHTRLGALFSLYLRRMLIAIVVALLVGTAASVSRIDYPECPCLCTG